MANEDFWNYAYSLQQQGILCDMQLCIANPPVVLPAHRLVMLASSAYYQATLLQDDLQDVYYFDGIQEENLQLLLAYCYRQVSWSELTKNAEAAVAAQTLQLVQHSDIMAESESATDSSRGMVKDDNCPEMVVVQIGSNGEEIKPNDTEDGTVISYETPNVLSNEDRSNTRQIFQGAVLSQSFKSANQLQSSGEKESDDENKNHGQIDSIEDANSVKHNQNEDKSTSKDCEKHSDEKRKKILVSPRKNTRSSTSDIKRKQGNAETVVVKNVVNTSSIKSISASPKSGDTNSTSNVSKAKPERSSSRMRKASSKYADYEDVPTFCQTQCDRDLGESEKRKAANMNKNSPVTGRRRKRISEVESEEGSSLVNRTGLKVISESSTENEKDPKKSKTARVLTEHDKDNSESEEKLNNASIATSNNSKVDGVNQENEISITIMLESSQEDDIAKNSQEDDIAKNTVEQVCDKVKPDEDAAKPLEDGMDFTSFSEGDGHTDEPRQKRKYVKREYTDILVGISSACEVCEASFTTLSTCMSHEKRDHNHSRVLSCINCSKTFKEKRQFVRHVTDVHNRNCYECDVCSTQFKSKEGLALHKRKKHSANSATLQCDECDKKFHLAAELKSHKIFRHSTERSESCDKCHRTFKTKGLLRRHKNTYHSTERKHMCDICGSMFKTVNDMKMHRKKHYKADGTFVEEIVPRTKLMYPPGDYPCRFCGKVFSKHHVKATHERTIHIEKLQGNLFICTICNKSFPIKQSLMNHIKNKHLPRRYQCSACQQKFVTHKELIRHVENPERCKGSIRQTRKPFWCAECQIGFSLKGNLTKHIQKGLCLRNKKVTTNYVVVLQKTGEPGDGSTSSNKKLEKIIALDEGWDRVQDIVEGYRENSMLEVELLNEQTVEAIDEEIVDSVEEIVEQSVVETVDGLITGEEIILQQQEDGTMTIPYSSSDGQTTIQTLNMSELHQAALAGGDIEILMPEGTNIEDIASAMGGNVQIHVDDESDTIQTAVVLSGGDVIQGDSVQIVDVSDTALLQTEETEQVEQTVVQDSYSLACSETDLDAAKGE